MKKKLYLALTGIIAILAIILGMVIKGDHSEKKVKKTDSQVVLPVSKSKTDRGRLKKTLAKEDFNGVAILVDHHKLVDRYQAGCSDFSKEQKNQLDNSFEIDSLQKSLTAGLVMQQINQGKLQLTDHLSKYLPKIPGSSRITIKMMLDMRTGLTLKKMKYQGKFLTSRQLLKEIEREVKFDSKQVGKWSYQPVNYVLLSEILEKVTHKSYSQLFTQMYVKRLGIQQTEMAYSIEKNTKRALGYNLKENGSVISRTPDQTNRATILSEMGTGQVYMSIEDYYQSISSLLSGKLLGEKSTKLLYKSTKYQQGNDYHGGLYKRQKFHSANGYGYGFEDHVYISSDGDKALITFSNTQKSGEKKLKKATDKLAKEFFNKR